MSSFGITHVHYDDDHTRIEKAKGFEIIEKDGKKIKGTKFEKSRENVITDIEINKYDYITYVYNEKLWKACAKVKVIIIEGKKFIKTESNTTKKDNLGELPEY